MFTLSSGSCQERKVEFSSLSAMAVAIVDDAHAGAFANLLQSPAADLRQYGRENSRCNYVRLA